MPKLRAIRIADAGSGTIAGTVKETWDVLYIGDGSEGDSFVTFDVDNIDFSQQPPQIIAFVAASFRASALALGWTVPAGNVFIFDVVKA